MTRSTFITAALLALLSATPALAAPQWDRPGERASAPAAASWHEAQREISPQEARAIALRRVPGGEVVDIRRLPDAYRVRIITRDGRVVDIVVDARTGRVR
ncbi:PepSY domain-containing protein [uncultured Algimonas sp.]|uniref:PepSY domain-containing protein n=1 Tax=uncultured Algimonas sp. TaxID=1547920 RepID=UPI0026296D26|nr:PepSY domain-containing protein [uncultured Algimonas sp.]